MMAEFEWRSGWCNGTELGMDKACLHVVSQSPRNITLFSQFEECYMCKLLKWADIPPKGNVSLEVRTVYPVKMNFESNGQQWCNTTYNFEEYGQYGWNITVGSCDNIEVLERPITVLYPILGASLMLLLFALLWNLVKYYLNYTDTAIAQERVVPFLEKQSELGSPGLAEDPKVMKSEMLPGVQRQKSRVVSLDTFRGITIALMIFIHYGRGGYEIFRLSEWNGLHVADLLFPWFLWIMGASVVFSMRSQLKLSQSRQHMFLRVLKRSVILIALGFYINSAGKGRPGEDLSRIRLMGTLQRIGISYLIVGTIETTFVKPQGSVKIRRLLLVQDLLDSWLQWLLVIIVTTVYLAVTFLMPVPNCPTGYLGPGGLHYSLTEGDKFVSCTGGAAHYIDMLVLGKSHLFTRSHIYMSQPFEFSGLLGTLSSVLTVYLGVQAGRVMLYYPGTFPRVARWIIWAAITGFAAGVLCKFSKEEGWIPVNKNLWSLSFVLALASTSFLILSILYLVIDHRHWWSGTPFHYAGMNPMILFVGHYVNIVAFPFCWKPVFYNHTELLAMSLWATILWLIIAYVLFRKKVFLTI